MIQDEYLIEFAKSANDETYDTISHLAVGTETTTMDTEDTSLSGEIGTRKSVSGSRTNNGLEFSAIRISTDVIDTTDGDDLKRVAFFDASTDGDMFIQNPVSGLVQTNNYEVEFIQNITIVRS